MILMLYLQSEIGVGELTAQSECYTTTVYFYLWFIKLKYLVDYVIIPLKMLGGGGGGVKICPKII